MLHSAYILPSHLNFFSPQHNARPTPSPSSLDFFTPPRLTHYFQFDFKIFLMLLPAQNVLHLLSKHVLIAFMPGTIFPTYPSGSNVKRPLSQLSMSKILMPSSVLNGDTGGWITVFCLYLLGCVSSYTQWDYKLRRSRVIVSLRYPIFPLLSLFPPQLTMSCCRKPFLDNLE